jgi:pimeloyl-ACP methyl ester carboxylesterase
VPTLALDGRELYYEVAGDGPPVVLVHSAIADSSLWDEQVEALAPRFRVVRYDVAGFGRSPLRPGPFSHLADLQTLVEHLGLGEAAVVGNSSGARIALEYGLAHPEIVQRLVLIAGGLPNHDSSKEMQHADAEEERLFEAGDFDGAADAQLRFWVDGPARGPDAVEPGLRERFRRMILRSYELYAKAAEEGEPGPVKWLDPPAIERLGEIRVPTLVVVGEADVSDMVAIADRLDREIPGARQALVPGAAHGLPLERPEELNRLLLDFLAER